MVSFEGSFIFENANQATKMPKIEINKYKNIAVSNCSFII